MSRLFLFIISNYAALSRLSKTLLAHTDVNRKLKCSTFPWGFLQRILHHVHKWQKVLAEAHPQGATKEIDRDGRRLMIFWIPRYSENWRWKEEWEAANWHQKAQLLEDLPSGVNMYRRPWVHEKKEEKWKKETRGKFLLNSSIRKLMCNNTS